jgi:hypothetical protein
MQGDDIAKPGREGYLHWVPFWQFVPHFLTEKGKRLLRKMLFWLAMSALFSVSFSDTSSRELIGRSRSVIQTTRRHLSTLSSYEN